MTKVTFSREKSSTGSALAEFGFIPKGVLRNGVPSKFTLWGEGTVGCPQKPEAHNG